MFNVLPDWVSDLMILASFVLGPSGFVWAFLQQKGANRKLKVEEDGLEVQKGGLTVDQFNAALPAYKDLLDRANIDRDEAIEDLKKYKEELDELKANQVRLIRLFKQVIRQNKITLTDEQQIELEATKPRR